MNPLTIKGYFKVLIVPYTFSTFQTVHYLHPIELEPGLYQPVLQISSHH